jgi:methyl-accepting chemotaxis protein
MNRLRKGKKTMNFKNMSLRAKLIGGFATVILLLIVVSLVGFNALNNASSGFTQYREMARDANLSGRLQANMLMVRMNVKDFIITGSEKDKQQYQEYLEKMKGFLETAQKEINAPDRAKKIDAVDGAHLKYDEGFKQVVAFMDQRNHLVKDVLDVRGPLMEKNLTRIMESAQQDGDMIAAFNSGIAMKHLLLARVYMAKFLDTNQQAAADRVITEFGKMTDNLKILDRELQNPQRRKMLATVKTAQKEYVAAFNRLVNVIVERNTIISHTLDKIGPRIAALVEEVKLDIKSVQDEIGPRLQASNQKAEVSIVSVSVVALLAGIALVFFTTRSVTTQLGGDPSEIADVARHIAEGNLVIDFKSSGDGSSVGVYHDMETMTANLKQMFTDINGGVETLTTAATELSAISEQMTQGVQVASDKSNTVSAASEEMTANMSTVAAAMEQSATNTNMVATASEEMSSTIGEIAQNAEKARGISDEAAHKASSASENMNQLGNAANAIGKVIETITDISEQVNLLALNATIEAARAGEAGKGFAVVANEIKELAKQTAAATGDIKEKIQGIQGTTATTVDQISEINQVINDVNSVVTNIATSV